MIIYKILVPVQSLNFAISLTLIKFFVSLDKKDLGQSPIQSAQNLTGCG